MAKIATYTAPTDRIRPNDLGYTANIQIGRRLAGFASEEAAALTAGGRLAAQNVLTERKGAVALMDFINSLNEPPPQARNRAGGGATSGSLGNQDRGTAGPREVARAAPALISAVAGPATRLSAPAAGHMVTDRSLFSEPSAGMQGPFFDPDRQQRYDPPPPANSIRKLGAPNPTYGDKNITGTNMVGQQDVYIGGGGPSLGGGRDAGASVGTSIFAPEYLGLSGVPAAPDVQPAASNVFVRWYNEVTGAIGDAYRSAGSIGGSTDTQKNLDAFLSDAP